MNHKQAGLIKFPASVYLCWYLIILLYQIFIQPLYKITAESVTLYQRLYFSWVNYWDSGHYFSIATNGYHYPQQAFFPLWPLLIKTVSIIGISPYSASFVLSFIFGLLTFICFYLLASKLIEKKSAKLALILFASFPSAMFLHAAYTEGLFLTLTLLSFFFWERKQYLYSSLTAGLATATRLAGMAIIPVFILVNRKIPNKFYYIIISLLGLAFYFIFLWLVFGNGFLFIDAQKNWCVSQGRCDFVFPLSALINYVNLLLIGWVKPSLSSTFIDWLFSVIFIILLIPVYKKLGVQYFIYSLIIIFMPLFSSTVGMVRYVLVVFPVFFVVPTIIRNKFIFFLICFILFLLQLRFITLFTNRIWVA